MEKRHSYKPMSMVPHGATSRSIPSICTGKCGLNATLNSNKRIKVKCVYRKSLLHKGNTY